MSWSDNRREYLDKKYEAYDDESGAKYSKGSRRKPPKKADHKHEYRNCVLTFHEDVATAQSPKGHEMRQFYMMASYCTVCGKIGQFDEASDTYGYYRKAHSSFRSPEHISFKDMYEAYRKVLPMFEIPEWDCKYIPR